MRFLIIIVLFISTNIYTQTNTQDSLNVDISFIKQTFHSHEPITLELSIKNKNTTPISFTLSDILEQSIKFDLKTSRNENVPVNHKKSSQLKEFYSNPALYRNISLLPGESFSRLYNLREIYDINKYETFYIKGTFYPNPDNKQNVIVSDFKTFSHTPAPSIITKIIEDNISRNNEFDEISTLLPHEIIQNFFEAQFDKDWEKFLLFINTEDLLQSFHNYATQYNQSTNAEFKLGLLKDFQRFITIYWNIPLTSYEIDETIIREGVAYVTVNANESIRFTQRRIRYTFTLKKSTSGAWLISDYTVLALN